MRSCSDRAKSVLSALFAADHLGQLTYRPSTELLNAARELLADMSQSARTPTVGGLLDAAFAVLVRDFPVEYVFKSCAAKRILFGRHSPSTTSFYTEFRVGDSRADVLAVNGQAHVYEIKTRYDDLSRLTAQLRDYYSAFSLVTVFIDATHASAVEGCTPEYVGINTLSKRYSMSVVRTATPFDNGLDSRQLFRLLREREYLPILRARGFEPGHVDPVHRYRYCLDAAADLDPRELQKEVSRALKKRQATTRLATIAEALPESLRVAPFAYKMSLESWRGLTDHMALRA